MTTYFNKFNLLLLIFSVFSFMTKAQDNIECETPATVHFSVNASALISADYNTVLINGSWDAYGEFNEWWWPFGVTLSDTDFDGIHEGSLQLPPGDYQYVHALTGPADNNGGWGIVGLAPDECALGLDPESGDEAPNYYFSVECGETLFLPTLCFGLCDDVCDVTEPSTTVVEFEVDMNNVDQPSASFDNVVINGSWNNWQGWGVTLSDNDGDGIWSGSAEFENFSQFEYVVAVTGPADNYSGWGMQWGQACVGNNFSVNTGTDSLIIETPVVGCDEQQPDLMTVDFVVDMNPVGDFPNDDYSDVIINGSWNGWQNYGVTLSDDDGDNVWTGTGYIDPGVIQFEYVVAVTGPADSFSGAGQQWGNGCSGTNFLLIFDSGVNYYVQTPEIGCNEQQPDLMTVDFVVDMNPVGDFPNDDYSDVIINGSWNGWQNYGVTLSDDDGDNVWTGTGYIDPGVIQFEYVVAVTGPADNYSGWGMQWGNGCSGINFLLIFDSGVSYYVQTPEIGCEPPAPTEFNVDMNCVDVPFSSVHLTGPVWNWTTDIIMTDTDGDGIYSITMEGLSGDIEYKYMLDFWANQENLIDDMQNGASCAPITDYENWANRLTSSGTTNNDTYGSCEDCEPIVSGCTDSEATNFNPDAEQDDGSCTYDCINPNLINQDAICTQEVDPVCGCNGITYTNSCHAQNDGVLEWTIGNCEISGCTVSYANNFNPMATVDDGSCSYCDYFTVLVYDYDDASQIGSNDGYVIATGNGGSSNYDVQVFNTDGIQQNPFGLYAGDYTVVVLDVNFDCVAETTITISEPSPEVEGCMDQSATNYNAEATIDDGSCVYPSIPTTFNVDMSCAGVTFTTVHLTGPIWNWTQDIIMTDDDGDGIYSVTIDDVYGDVEYKYMVDYSANQEDLLDDMQNGASCAPVTDYSGYANRLVEAGSDINDTYGSCEDCPSDVLGCTDASATNYNSEATVDDGSCEFPVVVDPCDITPSGLFVDNIIHNRVVFNWSAPAEAPSYYMIRYRPVGTTQWTVMRAGPETPNAFTGTSRTRYFHEAATTYEWSMRARMVDEDLATICQSPWSASAEYTTLPQCANLENLAVDNVEANWVTFLADAPDASWGVWQSKGKIREVGTNAYRYVNGGSDGTIASVLKGNFTASTDYEWHTKVWCTANVDENGNPDPMYHSGWGDFSAFTTEAPCDKLPTNLTTSSNGANTAVTMSWDTPESGAPDHYFLEMTNLTTGAVYEWNYQDGESNSRTKFGQNPGDEISWRIRGACGSNGTSWATIFTQPVTYTLGGARLTSDGVSQLEVYPNPSRGVFTIGMDIVGIENIHLSITNHLGEEVFQEVLRNQKGHYINTIDLTDTASGVYMLNIISSKKNIHQKIVIH